MSTAVPDAPSTAAKARPKKKPRADDAHRLRVACDLLKAGSEPARAKILLILAEGERRVSELTAAVELTQPAVSHHLATLRMCQLIEPCRDGKSTIYSTTDTGRALAETLRTLMD
jgi:ArsR family transcriptional regulator, lead/cadmium/zinc/bismuth-responsive transcriptional repressor